jgi:DNA ligase-1
MKLIKEFDKLYNNSSNGLREWTIKVYEHDNCGIIKTYYGLCGGKITESINIVSEGKNIGKSNETTPITQALSIAESAFEKKNKTAFTSLSEADEFNKTNFLPMLAHRYDKRGKDIEYPAYIQPKLDGIRCVTVEIKEDLFSYPKYYSRTGKEFKSLSILDDDVCNFDLSKYNLDGEIYTQNLHFNDICSAVRSGKELNMFSQLLEYWVFDFDIKLTKFKDRYNEMINIFGQQKPIEDDIMKINSIGKIKMCPTFLVNSESEMLTYHKYFVKLGYEGTIVRNINGYYIHNRRSKHLQKIKDFITDEFIVVDINSGKGSDQGLAVFTCKTKDGKLFKVRPGGSSELRAEYLNNYKEYIGKPYTVKYQSMTRDGSLRFPTGIGFRDYE